MNLLPRLCLFTACLLGATAPAIATDQTRQCMDRVGQWLDPADGAVLTPAEHFDRLSDKSIVLLGEVHDNPDHHRWQLSVLAALHSRTDNLVVGLEMLPRAKQAQLTDWTLGKLGEQDFLEQVQWNELWGYDPQLYLPILHFARINRLPAIAINIDRQLVSKVGAQGWQALKPDERMGLSDPAAASDAYRHSLGELYAYKLSMGHDSYEHGGDDLALQAVMDTEAFANFVDAQLTWDRAMAESLANAQQADEDATVVGIIGRGHLEYGFGVPHQLADLGIENVAVLLPIDADMDCGSLEGELADAVFLVGPRADVEPQPRARLGVLIEDGEAGVRIMEVVDGSVAAQSDLRAGDVIVSAAGFKTPATGDLIEVIQRQAPGTWLPLEVIRDGKEMQFTARFPQQFD